MGEKTILVIDDDLSILETIDFLYWFNLNKLIVLSILFLVLNGDVG